MFTRVYKHFQGFTGEDKQGFTMVYNLSFTRVHKDLHEFTRVYMGKWTHTGIIGIIMG